MIEMDISCKRFCQFYSSLCRKQQVDKGCTGGHASLVTVFNVLGQVVQQLAGA